MATLFLASGPNDGAWFPIGHKSLVIGRDEGLLAQVVDPKISRRHLKIRYDENADEYYAKDMESANGVFLDGRRLIDETLLHDRQFIRIGETLLLFTRSNFRDEGNALAFYKKHGERARKTIREKLPGVKKPESDGEKG